MRAVKLTGPGTLGLEEVATPEPGPGQVRVRVAGAGLCHSDLHVLHLGDAWPVFGGTVGHEGGGWIDALGDDVTGLTEGDAVVVSVIWSCGSCRACIEGRDNACTVAGTRTGLPLTPGLGPDGSMAEYIIVPARHAVPIGALDPATAAPLTDAGVTPMHAINTVLDRLTPAATVVVIGLGGLGHVALQILAAVSAARVIALDTDPAKRASAAEHGADLVLDSNEHAVERILTETDGVDADVVLDLVGVQPTVDLARRVVAAEGAIRLIGLGGGSLPVNAGVEGESLPWGVNVQRSYGGTRQDLVDVIALAQRGRISIETVTYSLEQFQQAFDDLEAGRVAGRAILVP
ncbi:alcohol dehydrogenase catalytic domain-containing protein [Tsukamurella pseudospumae]|uniref:alcohol dehydrogenase n=1 Tax=Tsukamurella pseudospumae TaxID=239498 RepID=A0A138AUV9_9ACTN|nr:alcohol dehydrogenase catalytic domain-containing protein [Tsukamurella pseudospumae]KXO96120.1 dehydrogenase [Tsukamurella pseudospumae]KXP14257.1 dehydrogenase [Tsukamurella pseudospumae]